MVLQGSEEGLSPPFDSSIFGASYAPSTRGTDYEIEYEGCEAVAAFFTLPEDVTDVLPEGIEPFTDPPQGGVLVADYPFSTVGSYHEYLAVIQVADTNGEMAYYIPYIYVTNDAAMAAGRELAGAPKKMAEIDLEHEGDSVRATMDRPAGTRLLTVSAKPERRGDAAMVDSILPSPTPLLSIRHLPPVTGGDGLTQLVEWYTDIEFHESGDDRAVWFGPTNVDYEARTPIDPVHNLEPEEMLVGMYSQFDMTLGVTDVQREWEH